MSAACRSKLSVPSLAVAVTACLGALPAGYASAQGLFDLFFGNARRAPAPPTQALSYAPSHTPATPALSPRRPSSDAGRSAAYSGTGRSVSYCVRLCDGRFFPIQQHAGAESAQLCEAFCPASPTKLFRGGEIKHSVATDGTRYTSLENAFAYRNRMVPGCTCTGNGSTGLASVDPNTDPTLRPGDMVATAGGSVTVVGSRSSRVAQH